MNFHLTQLPYVMFRFIIKNVTSVKKQNPKTNNIHVQFKETNQSKLRVYQMKFQLKKHLIIQLLHVKFNLIIVNMKWKEKILIQKQKYNSIHADTIKTSFFFIIIKIKY